MVENHKLSFQIQQNLSTVLMQDTQLGRDLWQLLIKKHPADIASIISRLEKQDQQELLQKLPSQIIVDVFARLPEKIQAQLLVQLDIEQVSTILQQMSPYQLSDLFELFSDEDLKKFLTLLQETRRKKVISLLEFPPESAGGIMRSEEISFNEGLTIKKAVNVLQRLQPKQKHLHRRVFITDKDNKLLGFIYVDSLVLNKPDTFLKEIMESNELVINVREDQEKVAESMRHYDLSIAPVVDDANHLIGVITADEIFDIFKEEASEDVYKFSALTPVEYPYFQTSFWTLIWQRGPWLVALLILQSVSSTILTHYDALLAKYTIIPIFLTMLIGTGGNAGNQSGALVVRGLATGEMSTKNAAKLLIREFFISIVMALILALVAFFRVFTHAKSNLISSITISVSLFLIVVTSTMLGTFLPLLLERFNFDPAHSAAPFLATLMDIIGIMIYCLISSLLLA